MANGFIIIKDADPVDMAGKYRFLVDIGDGTFRSFKFDNDASIEEIAEAVNNYLAAE